MQSSDTPAPPRGPRARTGYTVSPADGGRKSGATELRKRAPKPRCPPSRPASHPEAPPGRHATTPRDRPRCHPPPDRAVPSHPRSRGTSPQTQALSMRSGVLCGTRESPQQREERRLRASAGHLQASHKLRSACSCGTADLGTQGGFWRPHETFTRPELLWLRHLMTVTPNVYAASSRCR